MDGEHKMDEPVFQYLFDFMTERLSGRLSRIPGIDTEAVFLLGVR